MQPQTGCSYPPVCRDGPTPHVEVLKEKVESPCEVLEHSVKYAQVVEEPLAGVPSRSPRGQSTCCCSWNRETEAARNWLCSQSRLGHNPAAEISKHHFP